MDAFYWSQQFETGLPRVDEQHHRLVDLINEFGSLVTQSAKVPPEEVERVFAELAAYAQFHFSEEESMMVEVGLKPDYIAYHHRQHADFLQDLTRIHTRLRSDDPQDPHRLLRILIHWLAYHILGIDQAMAGRLGQLAAPGCQLAQAAGIEQRRGDIDADRALGSLLQRQAIGLAAHLGQHAAQADLRQARRPRLFPLVARGLGQQRHRADRLAALPANLAIFRLPLCR